MSKPVSGATDEPRHESHPHPPDADPDPSTSWSEYIESDVEGAGVRMGGKRGVTAQQAHRSAKPRSDRPREQPTPGSQPDDADARARQYAGLRRYRGTSDSHRPFRAEPGPLARSGEPRLTERSDENIEQDVRNFLEQDGMVDAGSIEVYVDHGEVSLRGHVTSERTRYRAGELATRIAGVELVHNELEVVEPD